MVQLVILPDGFAQSHITRQNNIATVQCGNKESLNGPQTDAGNGGQQRYNLIVCQPFQFSQAQTFFVEVQLGYVVGAGPAGTRLSSKRALWRDRSLGDTTDAGGGVRSRGQRGVT